MDHENNSKAFQTVEGARVPHYFNADLVRSSMKYAVQPNDIFIVTFPKCGTTWMEVIVFGLLNQGRAFDDDIDFYFAQTPFLEGFGVQAVEKMMRPGSIKTHLLLEHVPYHPQAKYICLIRDPKDVCTSFHRFVVGIPISAHFQSDFATFFDDFVNGETMYGDYFAYVRSIWAHKNDKNVLLVSYEQMQADLSGVISQIARFLEINLDEQLFQRVLRYSSFNYMKEKYDNARNEFDQQQPSDKRSFDYCPLTIVEKGLIGGHRSLMTEEQIQHMNHLMNEMERVMPGLDQFWRSTSNRTKHVLDSTSSSSSVHVATRSIDQ